MKKQIVYGLIGTFALTFFATPLQSQAAGKCNIGTNSVYSSIMNSSNGNYQCPTGNVMGVYEKNNCSNINDTVNNLLNGNENCIPGTKIIIGNNGCSNIKDNNSCSLNNNCKSNTDCKSNTVCKSNTDCKSNSNCYNVLSGKDCNINGNTNIKNNCNNKLNNTNNNTEKTTINNTNSNTENNNTNNNINNNTGNNNGIQQDTNLTFAQEVVRLVNVERAKAGLSALTLDSEIEKAATIRSNEIINNFSHTRPNGSSFSTVLKENNISYKLAGENIAWGQKTPEAVVTAWMNSEGHRANIMNASFSKIGVGNVKNSSGTIYWTQLFTN